MCLWTIKGINDIINYLNKEAITMNNLRSAIKHNFLKQIIFRLDYEGVMEADVEGCILALRQKFFDAGFVNMGKRTENQFDLQVKMDLNIPEENQFSVSNNNKNLVYIFSSDNKEILEISKSFFTLTVDIDQVYETFDKYIILLAESMEVIKSISPYFQPLRIGLRKINICFLDRLADLPMYFTRAAFNTDDVVEQFSDYDCLASNIVTILSKDNCQINYVRNIQEGMIQQEDGSQKTTYQIVIDIDVFKEGSREILPILSEKQTIENSLKRQNTIEFEMFIKSLSDKLIEALKQDTFQDDMIRGVI